MMKSYRSNVQYLVRKCSANIMGEGYNLWCNTTSKNVRARKSAGRWYFQVLFELRFEDWDAKRVTDVRGDVVEKFRALVADRKLSGFGSAEGKIIVKFLTFVNRFLGRAGVGPRANRHGSLPADRPVPSPLSQGDCDEGLGPTKQRSPREDVHTYLRHEWRELGAIQGKWYSQGKSINLLNPFAPKSDKFQISPAVSPDILHHTVWRTRVFIACSDDRWLYYQFSLLHLYIFFLKGWETVLFELGSERVVVSDWTFWLVSLSYVGPLHWLNCVSPSLSAYVIGWTFCMLIPTRLMLGRRLFQVFTGNSDATTVVTNDFATPILARGVRIHPKSWEVEVALMVELYGKRTG